MVEVRFMSENDITDSYKLIMKLMYRTQDCRVIPEVGFRSLIIRKEWDRAQDVAELIEKVMRLEVINFEDEKLFDQLAKIGSDTIAYIVRDVWIKDYQKRRKEQKVTRAKDFVKRMDGVTGDLLPEYDTDLLGAIYNVRKDRAKALRDIFLLGYETGKGSRIAE